MRCDRIFLALALLFLLFPFSPPGSLSLVRPVYASVGQPLTITASATPVAGRVPLNVAFAGAASGGSPPYALFWDFGDGTIAHGSVAAHVYGFPGNFTAEFWVQDSAVPPAKLSQSIIIKVHGTGTLTVRVLDQAGNPVSLATVRMLAGPEGQGSFINQTGSDGDIDFGQVAEGIYSLETSALGFQNSTDRVMVLRGNPTFKEVVLVRENGASNPQTPPLLLYLAAAAVAMIVLALSVILRRRIRHSCNRLGKGKTRGTVPPARPRSRQLRGTR